jgi:EAL domain-containing protein (putative c-di-GMP-specific phosphodiesterase class I)
VLINDIGRWVLGRATRQLAMWQADPQLRDLRVAVNISARHLLATSFLGDVRGALAAAGVRPSKLIVEVTETALLTDLDLAARHLGELRALGVSVALDDFGTGHTSFTQLRKLPIDTIKIDRSYIAAMGDAADDALTRIMTDIAAVLGVDVVAEGVERSDQLDALPALGCDLAQGFLICPPLPADQLARWVHATATPTALAS